MSKGKHLWSKLTGIQINLVHFSGIKNSIRLIAYPYIHINQWKRDSSVVDRWTDIIARAWV